MNKLKLTKKELEQVVNGKDFGVFEEIFNDIPMYHPDHTPERGETHRTYIEDDQREYRWFIFKDTRTNKEYCVNTIYHPEWPTDVFEKPDEIEYVDKPEDSSVYIKPIPKKEEVKILTKEQEEDKNLWDTYLSIKADCKVVEKNEKLKVPKEEINKIIDFLNKEKFNIYELRATVVPICIAYKLEEKSFWNWIQNKKYNIRKKPKMK